MEMEFSSGIMEKTLHIEFSSGIMEKMLHTEFSNGQNVLSMNYILNKYVTLHIKFSSGIPIHWQC